VCVVQELLEFLQPVEHVVVKVMRQ
jgi:hypothetical protein